MRGLWQWWRDLTRYGGPGHQRRVVRRMERAGWRRPPG